MTLSDEVEAVPDLNRTAPVIRFIDSRRIDRMLDLLVERGGSDLHLSVGRPPMFHRSDGLEPLRHRTITAADFEVMVGPITPPDAWQRFQSKGEVTFAYQLEDVARFRVNLFHQERGPAAVLRAIAPRTRSLAELGLPVQMERFTRFESGLVVVAGGSCSGRSTTLAALVDLVNEARSARIISIENPIEFVYQDRRSVIHQREIGTHARGTVEAMGAALHEDPDVVVVSDLCEPLAVCAAIEAAERGILVFGVVTARSVGRALARLAVAVSSIEGEEAHRRLADVLRGLSAQQLVPRAGGGRVVAVEWLQPDATTLELVREARLGELEAMLRQPSDVGVGMDDALLDLLRNGVISGVVALGHAFDPARVRERSRLGATPSH